jgi:hypothetical protein
LPDQITLLMDPSYNAAMCRITAALQRNRSHHSDMLQLRNRGVDASDFVETKGCDIAGNAASLAPNAKSVLSTCYIHKYRISNAVNVDSAAGGRRWGCSGCSQWQVVRR